MNSNQLSQRLKTVADFVKPGETVADIGSDHAYLPCYLVKNNRVEKAIAGEVVEGPFQSAVKQVEEDGLTANIEVRKGNGLTVLSPGEVTTVAIAGMGGPLISEILENGKDRLTGVQKLILQPNINAISIRLWLQEHGWQISDEKILEEDRKIYEVIMAERSADVKKLSEEELLLGPVLLKDKSPVFIAKWKHELVQLKKIKKQMELAEQNTSLLEKKKQLEQKIMLIEEAIK
ncbi:tRNA (adenine(22)-N(1))-methyltransferase [Jeotgalibacillus haloalkalitolerans]|uniref:tRNA (Adenine(22)-N(1))-methyltransferase TrmK n=1 Tax=Jeotgalibacillus haloalkalitolerans TaxID=3104292 RepID=A0ABU5KLQ9_9BACL|nr:tRNA (adenine(22)-N(1))-methyltransferase TrmK [Jeotgalibacillus sp. HH7-29]MDZ5712192.1 tRNA (adenine(22)-N(1))-methyltransferase TrmK [Jeotgalibacillus sp. HH7-29]